MLKEFKFTELYKIYSAINMKKDKYINRRDFLKVTGVTAATATAAMYGCAPRGEDFGALGHVPTDKMTYRNFPGLGDNVSLLGYGCMRWPTLPAPDSTGNIIDQDAVNHLIDYAIEHGVNYFDTAPTYVQGQSERSTA